MSSHVLLKTLFSTSKNDILFHPPVRKPEAIDNTHPRQDILLLGDIIFKNALKKPENKAFSGFFILQGMRESNSLQRFWSLVPIFSQTSIIKGLSTIYFTARTTYGQTFFVSYYQNLIS